MSHELKTGGDRGYLRTATEEAYAPREVVGEECVIYAMDYPNQFGPDDARAHNLIDIATTAEKMRIQTDAERWFKL
jgi:hypothetical protein